MSPCVPAAVTRRLGAGLTVLLLGTGLVACDASDVAQEPRAQSPAGTSPAPSEQPTEQPASSAAPQERGPRTTLSPAPRPLAGLPAAPARDDAPRLAAQIRRVEAVLRDPDARSADVRRAAEFEQLAGRLLGLGTYRYAEAVLDRLPPRVRAKTRAHAEAAQLLDSMGGPVPDFPDWRIVEPLPARVLLGHYRDAGRAVGVPWQHLAAVHLVETRMGRIRGVSSAGARGPMQFLPTTWDIYGRGGDINDHRDAIFAAARLLRANGAPGDMAEALWHYNPSDAYVGAVLRYAEQIRRSPAAYRGYWHWRVLYSHVDGPVVLEVGYPEVRPRPIG